MRPFDGVSRAQARARFNWLREVNSKETSPGVEFPGAWTFLNAYAEYDGNRFDSMQAALDTNTSYAQDLGLRLLTAILEGQVP